MFSNFVPLRKLLLCCISTKFWIQSFNYLVFFHLAQVVCFLIRAQILSEKKHYLCVIFGDIHSTSEAHKLRPAINQIQKKHKPVTESKMR